MENVLFDPKSFNKIFRELLIIGLLKDGPKTKDEIELEVMKFYGENEDVSTRTIERALKDIVKFWGIEIHKDKTHKSGKKKQFVKLDDFEYYKKILELMLTYILKDNLIKHSVETIIKNIENPFIFFATLYKAINEKRNILFDYYFENQDYVKKDMDLEPYDIVHRHGKWLLLGVSNKNPDSIVKQYFIHNIKNLRINTGITKPFTVKKHLYNKDEYYKYAWDIFVGNELFEVKIWFSDKVKNKIKNFPYHPTQQIKDIDNGIIVTVKSWGYIEIVNWVLGFGKEAKIISPKQAVDFIKDKITSTLENYN